MLLRLLLLFIVLPFVELWLLLEISHATTPLFTIAMVIGTGIAGTALARQQGWQTWNRIQQQLSSGRAPAGELLDGLMILIAGLLLVTPGVLTDAFGFLLLIPPVRRPLRRILANWLKARTAVQLQGYYSSNASGGPNAGTSADDQIIDVEFVRRPRHDEPERRRNLSNEESSR